ncbi:MAG TPA: SDR family NAD(P)-dependent oxidoreductase [Actinomycetota bacterium]|nr:SDR family NAD(P)-dependent oxidoreductase [Actinomycetota bacterium]
MNGEAAPGRLNPLREQVAVVTGGARGLGFAIASRLLEDGASAALFDRDPEAVARARDELVASHGLEGSERPVVDGYVVDVTDEGAVRAAVESVVRRRGRIDILVNNAGIFPHTPFEKLDFSEWRRVLGINLDGAFLCTHAVYPAMVERGYGRIVNISSATFFIGYPEMTPYISSKGGIVGFTRALAGEAGDHGITVNCITPGLIETEGALEEDPTGELFEEIVGGQAVKRRGRPEDIAECVAYLASPRAGFITGQTINVDGGHRYH